MTKDAEVMEVIEVIVEAIRLTFLRALAFDPGVRSLVGGSNAGLYGVVERIVGTCSTPPRTPTPVRKAQWLVQ